MASIRIWISARAASSAAPDSSDRAFSRLAWAACRGVGQDEGQAGQVSRPSSSSQGTVNNNCPHPEHQFPHPLLTPRSSMSSVTASSASNCTEESAFTVTEPLLTVVGRCHSDCSRRRAEDLSRLCTSPVGSGPPVQGDPVRPGLRPSMYVATKGFLGLLSSP